MSELMLNFLGCFAPGIYKCMIYICFFFFFSPTEEFLEHAVTYQQFVDNPAIIDDPNLVVKIGNK